MSRRPPSSTLFPSAAPSRSLPAGGAPGAQVAAAVVYRPERLAELFARTHHTTPSAYRAAMR